MIILCIIYNAICHIISLCLPPTVRGRPQETGEARPGSGGRSTANSCSNWLRTNGVNTNGAEAKVTKFDRLGKKACPGTSGEIKVGQRECPKGPLCRKN